MRDPQAPTARPSDQAVLWFLAVPCGVQLGSPAGKARHAIPVAAEWLHLEHPLQAVSILVIISVSTGLGPGLFWILLLGSVEL